MIHFKLKEDNEPTQLNPKYDLDANILEIQAVKTTNWSYGLDINGTVIFDLNDEYIIENIDILIPKKLWKKSNKSLNPPTRLIKNKTLKVEEESIRKKSFYLEDGIRPITDGNYVLFSFNKNLNLDKTEAIVLSKKCYLLIEVGIGVVMGLMISLNRI